MYVLCNESLNVIYIADEVKYEGVNPTVKVGENVFNVAFSFLKFESKSVPEEVTENPRMYDYNPELDKFVLNENYVPPEKSLEDRIRLLEEMVDILLLGGI